MGYRRDHWSDHSPTADLERHGAPGRATLTSRLAPRRVDRASDGRGADPDAEAAVARAAGSTGAPLPALIQCQFEGSLGADLSSVRVHTGPASQAATQAVGAQAYATGHDIHFASGKYAPDDPFGLHLLAHEVAHTVQQADGPAPRQHRLEVSSPGDASEHEADRAADAMVRGAPATVGGAGRSIARKEEPKPYAGPTPDNDFDLDTLPPATRAQIDAMTIQALRPLVQSHVVASYVAFAQACEHVKQKLKAKQSAREESEKKRMDLLMGAVGMLLGPLGGPVVATAIAGVQQQLMGSLAGNLKLGLSSGAGSLALGLTDALSNKLAAQQLSKALTAVTPETATGWVSGAATKVGSLLGSVLITGGEEEIAASYVDAMLIAGDKSQSALLDAVATSRDQAGLLGAYGHFAGGNLVRYRAEVETKAMHFVSQIAPTLDRNHGHGQIVRIEAYGKLRLARVQHNPNPGMLGEGGQHTFHSWITPDMEAMALALNPAPPIYAASSIAGHLPDPVKEGAQYGGEVIVQVNAWGRPRLAVVAGHSSAWSGPTGDLVFQRWVPDAADEQTAARVKGGAQIGGIRDVDPGTIKLLHAPES